MSDGSRHRARALPSDLAEICRQAETVVRAAPPRNLALTALDMAILRDILSITMMDPAMPPPIREWVESLIQRLDVLLAQYGPLVARLLRVMGLPDPGVH